MAERQQTDIIDRTTDWGTAVAEVSPRNTTFAKVLLTTAFTLLGAGSILLIPVVAGVLLFNSNTGAMAELLIVGTLLLLAMAFKRKSVNQPRNALQLDYSACELRLGSELPNGVFLRQQVVGFRDIEDVFVDTSGSDPTLCIRIPGELVKLPFNGADTASLNDLVSKISAAHESALRAPMHSRIQSRMMGFEASFREVKQRIRTRIVS